MPPAEHVAGAPVATSVSAATSHIHPTLLTGRLPGSGRCRVEVNADGHVADDGVKCLGHRSLRGLIKGNRARGHSKKQHAVGVQSARAELPRCCRATKVSRASFLLLALFSHLPFTVQAKQDTSTSPRGRKGRYRADYVESPITYFPRQGRVTPALRNPSLGAAERRYQRGLGPVGIRALLPPPLLLGPY